MDIENFELEIYNFINSNKEDKNLLVSFSADVVKYLEDRKWLLIDNSLLPLSTPNQMFFKNSKFPFILGIEVDFNVRLFHYFYSITKYFRPIE